MNDQELRIESLKIAQSQLRDCTLPQVIDGASAVYDWIMRRSPNLSVRQENSHREFSDR